MKSYDKFVAAFPGSELPRSGEITADQFNELASIAFYDYPELK